MTWCSAPRTRCWPSRTSGKKSLKEISDFLEEHGLRFGMQLEEGEDGPALLRGPKMPVGIAEIGDE